MSDIEDQKFGLAGNEQAQGYEPLVPASPVDIPESDHMSEHELAHAKRPVEADWGPEPVERDYVNNQTGEATPSNQVVGERQAAADLAAVRAAEADVRKQQGDRDLADALDQLNARDQGQQPADQQPQDPAALDGPQPEQSEAERDAAHAQANAAFAEADAEISKMLENPVVRERIEVEFNQVRAEADAKVAQGFAQVEQAKTAYLQHANALTGQLNALVLSNFPELQGVAHDHQQLAGAVQLLAKTNPQRAQALQDFVLRASTVAGQLEQQGQAHRQAQAAQQEQALTEYTNNEIKRYEHWTAREVGDMKAVRENLQPILQKAYGIDANQLKQIHDGKIAIDGARLLRSAEFQAVLTDAIRYRLAAQGARNAVARSVPSVQRPGTSVAGPRADDGDLAAAASRLNLPGGSEGQAGLKNAAAWLTARRARGG